MQALPHLLAPDEIVTTSSDSAGSWIEVKVARRWREAADIVALELVPSTAGARLPTFEAGAYVDVLTPGGHLRPYSLCNPPGEQHRYVIAVLLERRGRGGSISLHDRVFPGDGLRIRAPRNEFPLVLPAVHSVLLAGGIGITPLLAMAESLWTRGSPFELHYCARNVERAAFAEELRRKRYAHCVRFRWSEGRGHLDFTKVLQRSSRSSEVYVCGPARFIVVATAAFHGACRPSSKLHIEAFSSGPDPRYRQSA
jgi:vanillate monooxygenase ferredoxin subunit